MSAFLYSLGRKAFDSRKTVLALWLLVLALAGGAAGLFNKGMDNSVSIPGTESQEALDRLAVTFPQTSGASGQIVVVAPDGSDVRDPAIQREVEATADELGQLDQAAQVVSPYATNIGGTISENGRAGIITLQLDGEPTSISDATKDKIAGITEDLRERLPTGVEASHGGPLYAQEMPGMSITEVLGLIVAMVVLLITLGSFLAAGMPLINALIGVGISTTLILLATAFGTINATTPLLALMLGLAVGIDYALFIVSRHQQELAGGSSAREAAARSVATAGSAVIFAGLTVMIALVGLGVAGIPFLTTMGVAGAGAVGIAVLVSVTLIPAMLGFAGSRLRPRQRRAARARGAKQPFGARFFSGWVRAVTRFPIVTVLAVVGVLGLIAVPTLGLRLALPDAGAMPKENPARVTYDRISEHFPEGFNGPLIVTGDITTSNDPLRLMNDLEGEIERLPGVADVPLATPNPTANTGIVQVIPEGAPDSPQTNDLVNEIRSMNGYFQDNYGIDISVTGQTAVGIDVSEKLGSALLPFGIVVVGLSLILLTMVFRSIAVPIKATLGYLLSIGASMGVITLVFQDGWLAGLFGVDSTGPVISFMPIVLMGVLFGLAMDYQVFLVSRMREEYVHHGDARGAINTGFISSARVVTAAAVIMFAVFVAFVPEGDANLKPIALGLAVGVFVDAFIVRMTLVPAALVLLGDRAWWMPRWLDRVLPSFDVEGEKLRDELDLRDWPQPDSRDVVACEGLRLADPSTGRSVYHDVGFRLPEHGNHVVHGEDSASVTSLLLTLSGRVKPDAGKLKVLGHVLPARASSVRSRVAYVDAGEGGAPSVREALAEQPRLLVLDGTDRVTDPNERRLIREALNGARISVIAGTTGLADVRAVLPPTDPCTHAELPGEQAAPAHSLTGAIR